LFVSVAMSGTGSIRQFVSKATRAETPPEWPFDLACSRPSQAAISSSLLLIFSFRVWGHLGRGKGAQSHRGLRPFAYNVSGVPPTIPLIPRER
jgi:hypothetical protein